MAVTTLTSKHVTRDVGCRTDQNSNLMDIGMPHGNIKLKAARYGNLGLASASGKYGKKLRRLRGI